MIMEGNRIQMLNTDSKSLLRAILDVLIKHTQTHTHNVEIGALWQSQLIHKSV